MFSVGEVHLCNNEERDDEIRLHDGGGPHGCGEYVDLDNVWHQQEHGYGSEQNSATSCRSVKCRLFFAFVDLARRKVNYSYLSFLKLVVKLFNMFLLIFCFRIIIYDCNAALIGFEKFCTQ